MSKRECALCGFKADDEKYVFEKHDNHWYCGNCLDTLI